MVFDLISRAEDQTKRAGTLPAPYSKLQRLYR
jgi:hypothetical protein